MIENESISTPQDASKEIFKGYAFVPVWILALSIGMASPKSCFAFSFKFDEISGSLDTTLTTGGSVRLEDRDSSLIGRANGGEGFSVNGDDGNLHYSKGSFVTSVSKATHDLKVDYRNWSGFFRANYFVDWTNRTKKELSESARKAAGQGFNLLDAYVKSSWKPGGHSLDVRLGRQVVNWGESTFISGGLSVVNPTDVSRLRVAGAETRESLLPSSMLLGRLHLNDRNSLESFYLFEFDRTKGDVFGTYFSTDDVTAEKGEGLTYTGFGQFPEKTPGRILSRLEDDLARDDGQGGIAWHYFAPQLHDTEFGFYFLNYHSHLAIGSGVARNPGQGPYVLLEYPEDIQSYAASFNTEIGNTGIVFQGEYSYRPNMPLQIETNEVLVAAQYNSLGQLPAVQSPGEIVHGYRRLGVSQLQGTLAKSFGTANPFLANDWQVVGEAAFVDVRHFPSQQTLRFEAPGTNLSAYPGVGSPQLQTSGWADAFSYGYVLSTTTLYNNVWKDLNLIPRFSFSHNVKGNSPGPGTGFVEGRLSFTGGITCTYLERWSGEVSYTQFWGASDRNTLHDRDFVSFNLKYFF